RRRFMLKLGNRRHREYTDSTGDILQQHKPHSVDELQLPRTSARCREQFELAVERLYLSDSSQQSGLQLEGLVGAHDAGRDECKLAQRVSGGAETAPHAIA